MADVYRSKSVRKAEVKNSFESNLLQTKIKHMEKEYRNIVKSISREQKSIHRTYWDRRKKQHEFYQNRTSHYELKMIKARVRPCTV